MHTARHVADILERIAPPDGDGPGEPLGFLFGDPDQPVNGVGCVWNADLRSIASCAQQGLDLLLCHENPWLAAKAASGEKEAPANQARRDLLEKHRIVMYRSCVNWDDLPGDGVVDQAVAALPIPGLRPIGRGRLFSVQEMAESMAVRSLTSRVEHGLGMPGCRIWGNPWQQVRRFAVLIGSFDAAHGHIPQAARRMGAEVLIIGEMVERLLVTALEQGLAVIQTLHSAIQAPGIRRQAEVLSACLPVPVRYVPSGLPAFQGKRPGHGAPGAADATRGPRHG